MLLQNLPRSCLILFCEFYFFPQSKHDQAKLDLSKAHLSQSWKSDQVTEPLHRPPSPLKTPRCPPPSARLNPSLVFTVLKSGALEIPNPPSYSNTRNESDINTTQGWVAEHGELQNGGDRRWWAGDCVPIEPSLLVASNSSLIKSLNPPHFKAPYFIINTLILPSHPASHNPLHHSYIHF